MVIGLKRVAENGPVELQALYYAAMLATVDFPRVVGTHSELLEEIQHDPLEAGRLLLSFLDVTTAEGVTISKYAAHYFYRAQFPARSDDYRALAQ